MLDLDIDLAATYTRYMECQDGRRGSIHGLTGARVAEQVDRFYNSGLFDHVFQDAAGSIHMSGCDRNGEWARLVWSAAV